MPTTLWLARQSRRALSRWPPYTLWSSSSKSTALSSSFLSASSSTTTSSSSAAAPTAAVAFRLLRRVVAGGVFVWVLSKGSWGFIDDIQVVQGSREEFLARFLPRPPAQGERAALQRKVLERAFEQPVWGKVTDYVRDRVRDQLRDTRWSAGLHKLLPLGDVTYGNRVQIFKDGDAYLNDVWAAIRNAKRRVWVEVFSIKDDVVGRKTLTLLREAAARGVDVVLIYDYIGSLGFDPEPYLQPGPNTCVAVYNPVFPLRRKVGPLMGRDHRKVIIADDVGYCGGRNLTAAYAGPETTGGGPAYHDVSVKLEGPCVGDLARAVLATLYQIHPDMAARKDVPLRLFLDGTPYDGHTPPVGGGGVAGGGGDDGGGDGGGGTDGAIAGALVTADGSAPTRSDHHRGSGSGNNTSVPAAAPQPPTPPRPGVLVQVLRQNVRHHLRSIDKAVRIILRDVAEDRCLITTPYFMPTPKLRRDLIKASRNGVDVRILTTGKPLQVQDDIVVNYLQMHAHRHIYGKFLTEGVRIFEHQAALHSKTITVDGNLAVVGSFNFDAWSARRNQEITAAMLDRQIAEDLEQLFCDRCREEEAQEVTLGEWQGRTRAEVFLDWLCYHIVAFASLDSLCVYRQEQGDLTLDEKETHFVRHVVEEAFDQAY